MLRIILIIILAIILLGLCLFLLNGCLGGGTPPEPTSEPPPAFGANPGGPYMVDEGMPLLLDGSASTGNITASVWDFGDTATGEGITVTHVYADGPNVFTATLTVTDDQGETAVGAAQVTVNNLPPAANANTTGTPYTCTINEAIQLTGECTDPSPIDNDGLACTWADFNGAAMSEPSFTCPPTPGEVTVTLTATDKDGASAVSSVPVVVRDGPPPEPLTANPNGPYIGTLNNPILFDGSGSSPTDAITLYQWEFGDGGSDQGVLTPHTYAATGDYVVTLTVTGVNGQTASATTQATVTEAPVAVINSSLCDKSGLCFRLDGSGSSDPDGQIASYLWEFGDGQTSTEAVVNHTYASQGSYTVILTVTDDKGAMASASLSIP